MAAYTKDTQPFIGVVCDASYSVLAARIKQAGYRIARISPMMLIAGRRPSVDIWVVDCDDSDAVADVISELDAPVVALSNRPDVGDVEAYRAWASRIIATLNRWTADAWQGRPDAANSTADHFAAVDGVWLLAGAAGAESAVREFLEALTWVPPVTFVYAQHIDPADQLGLVNRLAKSNRHLRCTLAVGRHWFNPCQLLVVPASCRLQFGHQGEVFSLRDAWGGRYDPHIDALMMSLAGLNPRLSGAIVFSGASSDGLLGAQALHGIGCPIWAQDVHSATEPAMPNAIATLRLDSKVGTPTELAAAFLDLYPEVEVTPSQHSQTTEISDALTAYLRSSGGEESSASADTDSSSPGSDPARH